MKPLAQNTLIQNRYLIVHRIGKGGMGEVYLAVDQRLGSAVALKRTFFAGDEMLGNAFEREARTLARMRHPVLPKVSDHFGENDEQYLVMEHISGDDLSKRLDSAGKPFPVSWVLFWADQLLDALSYLHTHEPPIIHRDIKPQNLKLTDENHIILLDFGLSKTSTGQTNISQSGSTGSVVGYTPHYAPMEQIRGIGTSARSDLYSLSATLYQLLTNTIPVDALTRADALLNELPDPIKPPHELNPEVPAAVSAIILRGMEVSQEKRFANAREMQRVLRKAFSEMQQATNAQTVAFTAEETAVMTGAAGIVTGAASLPGDRSQEPEVPEVQASSPEAAIQPDENIDLEATMAFPPPESDSGVRQADVKTEVFNAGGSSDPFAAAGLADTGTSDGVLASEIPSEPDGFDAGPASVIPPESTAEPSFADATVPFIALDHTTSEPSDAGQVSGAPAPFGEQFVQEQSIPEFVPPTEEDEPEHVEPPVAAVAAPSYAHPAARPQKKSSGKAIAIIGGLAAVLLLGAALAGGIWAYMKYGSAAAVTEATPEPTPEATIFDEPTPDPNFGLADNSNTSNTNSEVPSNSDSNSDLTVEPTPERTPAETGPRSTPRPVGTPRPVTTPERRPTPRRTPVTRPTVLP
ncbi:MAG: protein kinase [Chloracidobacterium sp.]|nr:protein kinase [Chloracidobacterium sp.]